MTKEFGMFVPKRLYLQREEKGIHTTIGLAASCKQRRAQHAHVGHRQGGGYGNGHHLQLF